MKGNELWGGEAAQVLDGVSRRAWPGMLSAAMATASGTRLHTKMWWGWLVVKMPLCCHRLSKNHCLAPYFCPLFLERSCPLTEPSHPFQPPPSTAYLPLTSPPCACQIQKRKKKERENLKYLTASLISSLTVQLISKVLNIDSCLGKESSYQNAISIYVYICIAMKQIHEI